MTNTHTMLAIVDTSLVLVLVLVFLLIFTNAKRPFIRVSLYLIAPMMVRYIVSKTLGIEYRTISMNNRLGNNSRLIETALGNATGFRWYLKPEVAPILIVKALREILRQKRAVGQVKIYKGIDGVTLDLSK